jgi:hypothetical protein
MGMKIGIKMGAALMMGLSTLGVAAQTVVIDGEIRPRAEYRDGYTVPLAETNDPAAMVIQRTRVGMTYTSGVLTSQITLQDSRTFGQSANASGDATTGIFEAWAELLVMPGGTLKVGRQPLKYDDGRFFSASAWSNTGTAHDLALFKYQVNDFQIHLGAAYNNNSLTSTNKLLSESYYSPVSNYRYMGFLWLSKDLFKGLSMTAMAVDEGVQDTAGVGTAYHQKVSMNHAYTLGGNLKYQDPSARLNVLATAYFQTGKNAKGYDMTGKMAALKVDYAFMPALSANIGMDYYSGDGHTKDSTQCNFKKLYGSDHTFNGYMDYWNTPLAQGLLDYYGGVTGKIGTKWSLEGALHLFHSEMAGQNKKKVAFGKDLGSELDLVVNYKLNPVTVLQAGWCTYFQNSNTLIAKDVAASTKVHAPQWAYVMLTIKPTFFSSAMLSK